MRLSALVFTALSTTLLSMPAGALTQGQQDRVDLYWSLTEACRAGDRSAGQCDRAKALKGELEAEELCFTWGEGDGFHVCDGAPGADADQAIGLPFDSEVVRSVFNQLPLQDREHFHRHLALHGHYDGEIDGIYGTGTEGAIRAMALQVSASTEITLDMSIPGGVRDAIGRILTYE